MPILWLKVLFMDIQKQIEYWISTAVDDLQTAELLISNRKTLQGLFFCHLSIEKIIKAHIVGETGIIPPKSHNLLFLVTLTKLVISESNKDLCALLMTYQLEGRYPENYPDIPSYNVANEILLKTKSLFEWFKVRL